MGDLLGDADDVRLPLRWSSTPPGSTTILIPQTVARASWGVDGLIQATTFFASSPHQFETSSEHWGETRSADFTVAPWICHRSATETATVHGARRNIAGCDVVTFFVLTAGPAQPRIPSEWR